MLRELFQEDTCCESTWFLAFWRDIYPSVYHQPPDTSLNQIPTFKKALFQKQKDLTHVFIHKSTNAQQG